jgi:hypothetical protein
MGYEQPPVDTKDWTWTLTQACDQCGLDVSALQRSELGTKYRAQAGAFRELLGRKAVVGRRPPVADGAPPVWSALEYGCHVRDALAVLEERLARMLKSGMFGRRPKAPTFVDWNQDQAAIDGDYANADRDKLIYDLAATAGRVADQLDRVRGEQWERYGTRSDGKTFTVESLGRYFLHDVYHHRWDVEQGYEAIAEYDKAKAKARRAAQLAGDVELDS